MPENDKMVLEGLRVPAKRSRRFLLKVLVGTTSGHDSIFAVRARWRRKQVRNKNKKVGGVILKIRYKKGLKIKNLEIQVVFCNSMHSKL